MRPPRVDIGDGSAIEVRGDYGLMWHHTRPDTGEPCAPSTGWVGFLPLDPLGWTVESRDPLTLSPSLLCTVCKQHGWIRGGRWVPA